VKTIEIFGGGGHSAVLRTLSLLGSLNRRICGFALSDYAQISPYGETSHIPGTLSEMPKPAFRIKVAKIDA